MAKKTGTSMGGMEASARHRRKQARRRRAEEQTWEDQSGPVLLRLGGYEVYVKSNARRDLERARKLLLSAIAGEDVPGVVRSVSEDSRSDHLHPAS